MNIQAQSWADLQIAQPIDIRSIVLNTQLGAVQGAYTRSGNFLQSAWVATVPNLTGANTKLVSLDTTDAATTAEAAQWTAMHPMVNAVANSVVSKVIFLRAGAMWDNQIEINFTGASCNNVQLSFRDNLATNGLFLNSATAGVPVYGFGNAITGNNVLHITIAQPGVYSMVITMQISTNWNAFEMEWVVLP